ncbi:MAG: hypothetical protein A2901_01425 [Elusimicrobia bacterium RIFCSPLOWO2_01_FULL_54_10]|nr:MAG: hypothetical protein A2901_01425 [Elusimicrobia bacterium RIFCSPLOWO2_01_FULL_54_10]
MKKKTKAPEIPEQKTFPSVGIWLALAWSGFITWKYLQKYPLYASVFESALPSPFPFPSIEALLFYAKALVLFLGIAAGALAAGRFLLSFLRLPWASALEELVFSLSAGYGIISLIVLLMTSLHLIQRPFMFGLWAAGVASFIGIMNQAGTRQLLAEAGIQAATFLFKENYIILRLFLWIFLAMSFMMAFAPELFYDALVYHLAVPNLFLQENGLARVDGVLSKSPMIWHMLYLFGLALQDEILPKLIHGSTGVLIILGLGTLAKRLEMPRAGMLAGLFFLTIPMVQMNIWTSGVDIGGCLYAFLAIYAILVWTQTQEKGWVIASALLSGFAYGSKYQGGMIGISVFLILFFHFALYARDLRQFVKLAASFSAVVAVTVLPWLAKNIWDTGNPVFPFLTSLFERLGTQTYAHDPEQLGNFIAENRRFITASWTEFWKLPWLLTFGDSNQSSLSYPGPMLLSFLPMTFLIWRKLREKWAQAALLFIVSFFIFSFVSTHLTRYHLMGYPMLCFIFGMGFCALMEEKNLPARFLALAVLTVLLLENLQTGIFMINNSSKPWDVLAGKESREAYRMYTHPGLNPYPSNAMYRWIEKNLPRDVRILMVGESKAFDLKRPHIYSDVFGRNRLVSFTESAQNPEEVFARFQEAGVTHIFINFAETRRNYGYKMLKWQGNNLKRFEDFWNAHVRQVHQEIIPERYFPGQAPLLLYEVLPADSAAAIGPPPQNLMSILEQMHGPK